MKKSRFLKTAMLLLITVSISSFLGCSSKTASTAETTVYGKVTAISGNKVTVALGTMKQPGGDQKGGSAPQGTPPSGSPDNSQSSSKGTTSDNSNAAQGAASGSSQSGTSNTDSASGNSSAQKGAPPDGGTGGMPDMLTLTGESKTITISDTSIITRLDMKGPGSSNEQNSSSSSSNSSTNKTSAALSDITVGSILKITYKTSIENPAAVQIIGGMGGNTVNDSASGGNTQEVTGTGAYTLSSGSASKSNESMTASEKDQSAVIVSNGADLTLSNMKISTSGDSSSMDSSSFYGLNAAVLAKANSKISISNTTINTTGTGANGVFACGKGSSIDLSNVTINCKATGAHGVDATIAGTLTMKNVNITTAGDGAAAAIATDRGGGTITASGGTVITTGTKSPAVYSTGTITVSDAKLQSSSSEVAVIEGKNSITVNNCNMYTQKKCGVFIYQSMSGDADVGCGTFTMNGGSLSADEGPLFYSTNTKGVINLKNAALSCKSGILLKAGADQWGTSGSNGSDITFTADSQKLKGDIVLDNISTAALTLKNSSSLQGAVNTAKTAKLVSITLDKSSTWSVTADSYLTSLTDADTSLKNITSNGHTIYYDSTNSANSWLNGKTISLSDGGKITPVK